MGHDLNAAYRQFPVNHPGHSGTILQTEYGPTLWCHLAMCFGADAMQQLLRVLLLAGHYVVEFDYLADSGFEAFEELFHTVGLRVKPSKASARP